MSPTYYTRDSLGSIFFWPEGKGVLRPSQCVAINVPPDTIDTAVEYLNQLANEIQQRIDWTAGVLNYLEEAHG